MYIVLHCTVVHPISAEAKLQLTMKPGEDLDVPQALVSLVLDQITIALKKEQVLCINMHVLYSHLAIVK